MTGTGTGTPTERIELLAQQALVVEHRDGQDLVRVLDAEGRAQATIEVGPEGAVLKIEAAKMKIAVTGELDLAAKTMNLTADDLHLKGKRVGIESERGDVKIRANDDVRLDGERVMVNCD